MEEYEIKKPIPWLMLIITFIVSTILLVSLCLAILDPAKMDLIQAPDLPMGQTQCLQRPAVSEHVLLEITRPAGFPTPAIQKG